MRTIGIAIVSLMGIIVASTSAFAQRPLQLSLTPNAALFGSDERIDGLILNLWGDNPQRALALGLVNGSTGDSAGASLAFLVNYTENYRGVHVAAYNRSSGEFRGIQAGLLNYAEGTLSGGQIGPVNLAQDLCGLQFGIFNYAGTVRSGLQVGALNVIEENYTWFTEFPNALAPGMVFFNWRF